MSTPMSEDKGVPTLPDYQTSPARSTEHLAPKTEAQVGHGEKVEVKKYHNVALSEATAAQKPSLFTGRMFLVFPQSILHRALW